MYTSHWLPALSILCLMGSACSRGPGAEGGPPAVPSLARVLLGACTAGMQLCPQLLDRDTSSGIVADGRTTIRVTLLSPRPILAAKVHVTGAAQARILAFALDGTNVGESTWVGRGDPGWIRTVLEPGAQPPAYLAFEFEPQQGSVQITEVEAWAPGRSPPWMDPIDVLRSTPADDPTIALVHPNPDRADLLAGGTGDDDSAPATCVDLTLTVPVEPRSVARAFLAYQAQGIAGTFSLLRSINGQGAIGGMVLPSFTEPKLFIERIAPHLLVMGGNALRLCGPSAGVNRIHLESIRIVLEGERSPLSEPEPGTPQDALLDGHAESQATLTAGTTIGFAVHHAASVDAIFLRHDPAHSLQPLTVLVDGNEAQELARANLADGTAIAVKPTQAYREIGLYWSGELVQVQDVELVASVLGSAIPVPELVVDQPRDGQHHGGRVVVTGFVLGLAPGEPAPVIQLSGPHLQAPVEQVAVDSCFGLMGWLQPESNRPWTVDVVARLSSGLLLKQTLTLLNDGLAGLESSSPGDPKSQGAEQLGEQFGEEGAVAKGMLAPGRTVEVLLGSRVKLSAPANAVSSLLEVQLQRPPLHGLPRLNAGMVNVTAPQGSGYRFLPHGARFNARLTITLPYDPRLLPRGMTVDDIRTYYFDDAQQMYLPLERVQVDPEQESVVSVTDHFTDMINAVILKPESLSPQVFNPDALSKIAYANPTANMTLIKAPAPRPDGAAVLSYPFVIPPGRGKYTPALGLTYSSETGFGIAGHGWSLTTSSIEIDTRFGAAVYDVPDAGYLETRDAGWYGEESRIIHRYQWDGQSLVPTTEARGTTGCPDGLPTMEYALRKEGRFARIRRCGANHLDSFWEVTEKDGTVFIYGSTVDSRVMDVEPTHSFWQTGRCETNGRNIGRWLLKRVTDVNGNITEFTYSITENRPSFYVPFKTQGELSGFDGGSADASFGYCCEAEGGCVPVEATGWVNRRLVEVKYTAHVNASNTMDIAPSYAVRFGYELRKGSDGMLERESSGRLGFLVQEDHRLKSVSVVGLATLAGQVIREYRLFHEGPNALTQHKSRLRAVCACPVGGCPTALVEPAESVGGVEIHCTRFDYSDVTVALGEPTRWTTPDGISSIGEERTATLGGGFNPYGSIGFQLGNLPMTGSLSGTVDLNGGLEVSNTTLLLVDINGDGLPDLVVPDEGPLNQLDLDGNPARAGVYFNHGSPDAGFRAISGPTLPSDPSLHGYEGRIPVMGLTLGAHGSAGGMVGVGVDPVPSMNASGATGKGVNVQIAYPVDVDGDGLLDVVGPIILLQRRTSDNKAVFVPQRLNTDEQHDCDDPAEMPVPPPPPPTYPVPPQPSLKVDLRTTESPGKALNRITNKAVERVRVRDPVVRWRAPRSGNVAVYVSAKGLVECDGDADSNPKFQVLLVSGYPNPPAPPLLETPLFEASAVGDGLANAIEDLARNMGLPAGQTWSATAELVGAYALVTPTDLVDPDGQPAGETIYVNAGAEVVVAVASAGSCLAGLGTDVCNLVDVTVNVVYQDLECNGNGCTASTCGPDGLGEGCTDPSGQSVVRFNNKEDFRAVGTPEPLTLPLTGKVFVDGRVSLTRPVADEVDVRLVRRRCRPERLLEAGRTVQWRFPWDNPDFIRQNDVGMADPASGLRTFFNNIADLCQPPAVLAHATLRSTANGNNSVWFAELVGEDEPGTGLVDVKAGDQILLEVEGKGPIDPDLVVVEPVVLLYVEEYVRQDDVSQVNADSPGEHHAPPTSEAGQATYEVPVALGWRRTAPPGVRYQPVIATDDRVTIDFVLPFLPPSWLGEDKAHLVVQSSEGLLERIPIETQSLTELLGCPKPVACDQCPDPNRHECYPVDCTNLEFHKVKNNCPSALLLCPTVNTPDPSHWFENAITRMCQVPQHPVCDCSPDVGAGQCFSASACTGTFTLPYDRDCAPGTLVGVTGWPSEGECWNRELVAASHLLTACPPGDGTPPPIIGCMETTRECSLGDMGSCECWDVWKPGCIDRPTFTMGWCGDGSNDGTCFMGSSCFNPAKCNPVQAVIECATGGFVPCAAKPRLPCTPQACLDYGNSEIIPEGGRSCEAILYDFTGGILDGKPPAPHCPQAIPCLPDPPDCIGGASMRTVLEKFGCHYPRCELPFVPRMGPVVIHREYNISSLWDKTIFVSLEPPSRALIALPPNPTDLSRWIEYAGQWANPATLVTWVETQVFMAFVRGLKSFVANTQGLPNILPLNLAGLSINGSPATGSLNLLFPEQTYGWPVPGPLPPMSGMLFAEGFRGWGYAERVGGDQPLVPWIIPPKPTSPPTMVDGINAWLGSNQSVLERVRDIPTTMFPGMPTPQEVADFSGLLARSTPNRTSGRDMEAVVQRAEGLLTWRAGVPTVLPMRYGVVKGLPGYVGTCDESRISSGLMSSARCPPFRIASLDVMGPLGAVKGAREATQFAQQAMDALDSPTGTVSRASETRAPELPGSGGTACPPPLPNVFRNQSMTGASGFWFLSQSLQGSQGFMWTAYTEDLTGDGIPDVIDVSDNEDAEIAVRFRRTERRPGGPSKHWSFRNMLQWSPPNSTTSIQYNIGINTPVGYHFARGVGETYNRLLDINGDGLPDIVGDEAWTSEPCTGIAVRLNLGNRFADRTTCWSNLDGKVGESFTTTLSQSINASGSVVRPLNAGVSGSWTASLNDAHHMFIDINRDGLVDLVEVVRGVVQAWVNTGSGFGAPVALTPSGAHWDDAFNLNTAKGNLIKKGPFTIDEYGTVIVQLPNGKKVRVGIGEDLGRLSLSSVPGADVLDDLPDPDTWNHIGLRQNSGMSYSAGGGLTPALSYAIYAGGVSIKGTAAGGFSQTLASFADIDGDGLPDALRYSDGLVVVRNKSGGANLLTKVTNPLGGEIHLSYARTPNTFDAPQSRYVLSSVVQKNKHANGVAAGALGPGGRDAPPREWQNNLYCRYEGGRYDRSNREFLGFASVMCGEGEPQTVSRDSLGQVSVTYGMPMDLLGRITPEPHRATCTRYDLSAYEIAGVPISTTRSMVNRLEDACNAPPAALLQVDTTTYHIREVHPGVPSQCPAPAPLTADACRSTVALPETILVTRYEPHAPAPNRSSLMEWKAEYDAFGNPKIINKNGHPSDPDDDVLMAVAYAHESNEALRDRHVVTLPRIIISGKPQSETEPMEERKTEAEYDDLGRMVSFKAYGTNNGLPSVLSTTYAYDDQGNITEVHEPNSHVVNVVYDPALKQYPEQVLDNLGLTVLAKYDLRFGTKERETDPNGNQVVSAYDAWGRLTSVTTSMDGVQPAIRMEYRCNGVSNCATTYNKGAGSNAATPVETRVKVDGLGQVLWTAKTAELAGANWAVSGRARLDALGRVRLQGQPQAVNNLAALEVPRNGTVASSSAPLVNPTRVDQDALDRPTLHWAPGDEKSTWLYQAVLWQQRDNAGNPAGAPIERTSIRVMDAGGRGRFSVMDPFKEREVAVQEFQVTPNPFPTAASLGNAGAATTDYVYNHLDELVEIVDANRNRTRFMYDGFGRQITVSTPDTGTTRTAYDAAGRTESVTNASGQSVVYQYQLFSNRVVQVQRGSEPSFMTEYDGQGAPGPAAALACNLVGRVSRTTDEAGSVDWCYDELGRVRSLWRTLRNGSTAALCYRYDSLGRMLAIHYPIDPRLHSANNNPCSDQWPGERVVYDYNRAGQIKSVVGYSGSQQTVYAALIQYDEFGRRRGQRIMSGVEDGKERGFTQSLTYDPVTQRLTEVKAFTDQSYLQRLTLAWDKSGNVVGKNWSLPGSGARWVSSALPTSGVMDSLTYDGMNRLTGAKERLAFSDRSWKEHVSGFEYDAIHRMQRKTQTVRSGFANSRIPPTEVTQDDSYRYEQEWGGGGRPHVLDGIGPTRNPRTSYVHDPAGRLTNISHAGQTAATARVMKWTPEDFLRSVKDGSGNVIATYSYDRTGQRVGKETAGESVDYVGALATVNQTGLTKHVFLGDTRIASKVEPAGSSPSTYWYVTDHLGSTSVLVNQDGQVQEYVALFPYGEVFHADGVAQGAGPAGLERFLFTGKERDTETGWSYFGARYLDHGVAQWLAADPEWVKQGPMGLNLYQYAAWNPVRFIDPDGRTVYTGHIIRRPEDDKIDNDLALLMAGSQEFRNAFDDIDGDPKFNVYMWSFYAGGNLGYMQGSAGKGYASVIVDHTLNEGIRGFLSTFIPFSRINSISTLAHETFHAKDEQSLTSANLAWKNAKTHSEKQSAAKRYNAAHHWAYQSVYAHAEVYAKALVATGQTAFADGPIMTAQFILSAPVMVLDALFGLRSHIGREGLTSLQPPCMVNE